MLQSGALAAVTTRSVTDRWVNAVVLSCVSVDVASESCTTRPFSRDQRRASAFHLRPKARSALLDLLAYIQLIYSLLRRACCLFSAGITSLGDFLSSTRNVLVIEPSESFR